MMLLKNRIKDTERRRVLLALLGAGVGISGVLREAAAQQLVGAEQGIRRLEGDVRVNGAIANQGTRIRPGDAVTTGRDAYAMFVVGRDAYLLRENTRAEIAGRGDFVDLFRLVTGKVLGVFGKSADRRELTTRTATIGIRGTGAYLEAWPERNFSYFCLCYGSADIAANTGSREIFSSTYHEAPRIIHGDGRERAIEAAPVLNHSDSELLMLESLAGRRPPQTFIDSAGRY